MRTYDAFDPRITYEQNYTTRRIIVRFLGQVVAEVPMDAAPDAYETATEVAYRLTDAPQSGGER